MLTANRSIPCVQAEAASAPAPTRILVTYASEFGATRGVADLLAARLREHSAAVVDVQPVVNVHELSAYDAVVIGSAIYNGAWLPEAVHFVHFFASDLCRKPVAYFAVSMTMRADTAEHRRAVRSFLEPVVQAMPEVVPLDIGLFAGRIDVHKLPWLIRLRVRLTTHLRHGDYRKWQAIRAWADQILPALLTGVPTATPAAGLSDRSYVYGTEV
jgi:menaquinone-dependent protoporphyrinogen oxidase